MTIPYANHYTVTARGSVAKIVRCEQCGEQFIYDMDRVTAGSGVSPLFLDNEGAENRARTKAELELQKQLDKDVDPIPCPSCGWYQKDMVQHLRKHFHVWMWYLGAVLFLFSVIVLPVWINTPMTWPWALAAAGLLASAGFGLVLLRRGLAERHDPNVTGLDLRIQKGRERSFRLEERAKLLQVRQERQTAFQRSDTRSTYIPLIVIVIGFGLVATGAAVWCLVSGAAEVRDGLASLNWPTADGKITRSGYKLEGSGSRESKVADIQYSFTVDGKTYTTNQLWFGAFQKGTDNVHKFPAGTQVKVSYNPEDPNQSVLEPGAGGRAYFDVIVGAIVSAIALSLFGFAYYLRCRYRTLLASLGPTPAGESD